MQCAPARRLAPQPRLRRARLLLNRALGQPPLCPAPQRQLRAPPELTKSPGRRAARPTPAWGS
eukprot:10633474-Lingulodinium_polyedra.AAC.1